MYCGIIIEYGARENNFLRDFISGPYRYNRHHHHQSAYIVIHCWTKPFPSVFHLFRFFASLILFSAALLNSSVHRDIFFSQMGEKNVIFYRGCRKKYFICHAFMNHPVYPKVILKYASQYSVKLLY